MAATLTSSGTWTTISQTTTGLGRGKPNLRTTKDLNLQDLRDTPYSELDQFVELMATGLSLSHHQTMAVLEILVRQKMNRETPNQQLSRVASGS